jgi:O-antigen ligase
MILGRRELFKTSDFIWALAVSTLSISVYSVIQKFTSWGIATPEWAIETTRRVTAFYTSPNAVGLYLAPILMLMASRALSFKDKKKGKSFWALLIVLALSLLAIFFTKSQGAWIAVGAGVLVLLFFIGYKKITIGLAIAGIIFSLIVPSMREAVLFRDQANKNRLTLWNYSWTFLKASPKNFMLGTGVRQFFRKIQKPYYNVKVMERLIYPHNIFLNFWTEIGLFGMLAIIFILGYAAYLSNKIRQYNKIVGAGLLAMLTALVVHGLVDVPYFKNDLAFLFWILTAVVFIVYANICQSQTDGLRK